MTSDERRQALGEIAAEVRVCTRCRLHESRTRAVPGEGHSDTEVMFVGEGPGYNEDQQGRPFVGAAGTLLNDLLRSVGWSREEVFITNVVKCRPPGNRDPQPDEIAACRPYLQRQLAALDPALVVTLGRFSLATFMPGARIGGAHGTARAVDSELGTNDAMAYAMYHPAAALRQGALRQTLQEDMLGVPEALISVRERRSRAVEQGAGHGSDPAIEREVQRPVEPPSVAAHQAPSVATPDPDPLVAREPAGAIPQASSDRPRDDQLSLF